MVRGVLDTMALVVLASGTASLGAQGHRTPQAYSLERCESSVHDRDHDGLDDGCELALARAFAPLLAVDPRDCLIEGTGAARQLRGAYLFAAGRFESSIRIAYLPAYGRDCGWSGIARALHLGRRNDHDGDSELIVVDVVSVGSELWQSTDVFLSAHCGGRSDGRCRWFRVGDPEIQWADRARGAPVVWVARDKHANYPSRSDCESGHWRQDQCANDAVFYRFPIIERRNIGSRSYPFLALDGCVSASALGLTGDRHAPDAVECIWSDTTAFRGWQRSGTGARTTPYGRHLRAFGF